MVNYWVGTQKLPFRCSLLGLDYNTYRTTLSGSESAESTATATAEAGVSRKHWTNSETDLINQKITNF